MTVFISFSAYVALFALLLFGGAGTIDWARGWILILVLVVVRGTTAFAIYRVDPQLIEQRSRLPIHPGQPPIDRALLGLFMASFASLIAFAGWDGFRGHVIAAPPMVLRPLGLLAFTLGWTIVYFVLRANSFAVTVVRAQPDRAQRLVDVGPYAVVRHPMYASMPMVMLGMSLWLGSTAAAIASIVPMAILAARIRVEERVLLEHLPGYRAYRGRVRWRLIPGLW